MNMLTNYQLFVESKIRKVVSNNWFWVIVALVFLAGVLAYAVFCTTRGYNFTGDVKLAWPKFWQMGIGCTR